MSYPVDQELKPLFPPTSARHEVDNRSNFAKALGPASIIRTFLSLETWMLLAAVVQSTLYLFLPPSYAWAPAITLLAYRITHTVLVSAGFIENPYMKGSILSKTSAQLPDEDGNFGPPGSEKVAVLLLSAKFNHPLGFFSPLAKEVGEFAASMNKELDDANSQDNGFLGSTGWQRSDTQGAQHLVTISYWRSLDHVHRYAHGPLHSKVISWWAAHQDQLKHIGIMHEVFEAPAGMWESVYLNTQPTMMGATKILRRDGKEGEKEWISPLVDASGGELRSSHGRRGL